MPPVEAWAKVWIDGEAYQTDVHAYIACTDCHAGQSVIDGEPVTDMEQAHEGMILDPAADPAHGCESCHPNVAPHAADSLHYDLAGYDTALYERTVPENHPIIEEMQTYHCNDCHATCGDCHISQPDSVGGGLLEGHTFVRTPPMSRTCTACHGSRVKNEYYGLNEGYPGDVHLRQGRLACTDCHTGAELHGQDGLSDAVHRYAGEQAPTCESCHEDQIGPDSGIPEHEIHGTELLSCQTCHSVAYTNCTNCHVDRSADDVPFYTVESHDMGFFIGQNAIRNNERPYKYVPVRHVPVDPNSFDYYGEDLLVNFLNRPTWTYATPHNIQRNTPQTESCLSCHENDDVFLTPDKVVDFERGGANWDVIVERAPAFPEGYEQYLEDAAPAAEEPAPSGGDAGFWSDESAPADDGGFWSDEGESASQDDGGFWTDDSAPAEPADEAADFWGDPAPAEPADDAADFWGSEPAPAPTEEADSAESFWGEPAPAPTEGAESAEDFWG
ncbi:MAG: hypothetical protein GX613_13385 [Chloroflexi bacterium]|nr:hypothetical protein [Chloroflexota bacterium]